MSRPDANYVEMVRARLAEKLPDCDAELIDLYTLLALLFGEHTMPDAVHEAWAVWRNRTNPDHASLLPFDKLTPEVQALDEPYVLAIREAAA